MTLRSEVRACIKKLEFSDENCFPEIITRLRKAGAVKNIHLGKKTQFTDDESVEWYAGQILDIIESKQLFAVNSLINCLDEFCPEVPE